MLRDGLRISMVAFVLLLSGLLYADTDTLSLVTTPVFLKNGEKIVSQGTGFYFRDDDQLFLVTAYHVLTGRSPAEKKDPLGNAISFYCHMDSSRPQNVRWINLPIAGKEGARLVRPSRNNADLAAIALQPAEYASCDIMAITRDWITAPLESAPGSAVFVVGYPYGYSDTVNSLPVWKTGNLATSAAIDFEGLPLVLLDISIYPGMSGAPAIQLTRSAQGVTETRLIGVFTGIVERKNDRIGSNLSADGKYAMESLELAQVWKGDLLPALVAGGRDSAPGSRASGVGRHHP